MSIAEAFSDVPGASPITMTDSELFENNDEAENRVQNDLATTDDTGSSGYSVLTSNVNQRTDAQSSNDNDVQGIISKNDDNGLTLNMYQSTKGQS